jgi:hypothetical protein
MVTHNLPPLVTGCFTSPEYRVMVLFWALPTSNYQSQAVLFSEPQKKEGSSNVGFRYTDCYIPGPPSPVTWGLIGWFIGQYFPPASYLTHFIRGAPLLSSATLLLHVSLACSWLEGTGRKTSNLFSRRAKIICHNSYSLCSQFMERKEQMVQSPLETKTDQWLHKLATEINIIT